jgi:hypothetical protein
MTRHQLVRVGSLLASAYWGLRQPFSSFPFRQSRAKPPRSDTQERDEGQGMSPRAFTRRSRNLSSCFAARTRSAAGADPVKPSIALRVVLMLKNVEFRPK